MLIYHTHSPSSLHFHTGDNFNTSGRDESLVKVLGGEIL